MALTNLYLCDRAIKRNLFGPLGSFQDGFHKWLFDQHYCRDTMCVHIRAVSRFSHFLYKHSVYSYKQVVAKHVTNFLNTEKYSSRSSLRRFGEYLNTQGIALIPKPRSSGKNIIAQYAAWLATDQHLCERSCLDRVGHLHRFIVETQFSLSKTKLMSLTEKKIEKLFLSYSDGKSQSIRRSMQSTIRLFLRFCYLETHTEKDLSFAVPSFRQYKLSTLPKGIDESDAVKIICAIDRETPKGKRDLAMLNLVFHYGMRGGQVIGLKLNDIDWRKQLITIRPLKQGRRIVFPLLPDVGNALLTYIRDVRPETHFNEVFITLKAPCKPHAGSFVFRNIVSYWAPKAQVSLPSMGARIFRHGFATRMLELDQPIKHISDSLGHRSIKTTCIYAKVDFHALKDVAIELP